jgi:murein tripeptide amidase MpaA
VDCIAASITKFESIESNKAPGEDSVKLEFFKYASQEPLTQLLKLLYTVEGRRTQGCWNKAVVILIYKQEVARTVRTTEELVY